MNNVVPLRQASREIVRQLGLLKTKVEELDLSYSEGHALLEVARHNLLTTGELARILQLDKSTISRIVYRLEKKGWLMYSENVPDRRQKPFVLTSKGQNKVRDINLYANRQVEEALAFLSPKDQDTVLKGMQLYAKALDRSRNLKDFILRPIEKEDAPRLANVVRRVSSEFATCGPGGPTDDPELKNLFDVYQSPKSGYFVISKKERIMGGAGFGPLKGGKKNICELQKMYLLPEARGYGLGQSLVKKCLELAQEQGYTHCYLETTQRMEKARRIYRKMGFLPLKKSMGNTGHYQCGCWFLKEL